MSIASQYLANKADKFSHVVLVADSDFFFKDTTKVLSIVDADPTRPKMTPVKWKKLDTTGRKLLVRYKVNLAVKPPASGGDVETGAVTITLSDPVATAVIAVAYVDDDGA